MGKLENDPQLAAERDQHMQEVINGRGDGLRVMMREIPGLSDKDAFANGAYRFQCPPLESYSIQMAYDHLDYMTTRGREYSRRNGLRLATVSFSTLVVDWASFVVEPEFDIYTLTDGLKETLRSGAPFEFLMTHAYGDRAEVHMDATLRSLSIQERAGEGDARYIDVAFHQYRDPVVARRKGSPPKRKGKDPKLPASPKLTAKDTLYSLSIKYYGRSTDWKAIAKANGLTDWGPKDEIVKHKRFKVGDKIKIPAPKDRITNAKGSGKMQLEKDVWE